MPPLRENSVESVAAMMRWPIAALMLFLLAAPALAGLGDGIAAYRKTSRARLRVRFTPHMARREFATVGNERGFSRFDLKEAGSWTSAKSLDAYVEVDRKRAREVLRGISGGRTRGKRTTA